jgi:hypothetical protein
LQFRVDADSLARHCDGRSDQLLPRQRSETLVRGGQSRDGSWNSRRQRSGAARGVDGSVFREIHVLFRRTRRDLAEIQRPHAFRRRVVEEEESTAAQVAGLRVHDGERECDGDRGVDGVAAALQHGHADARRIRRSRGQRRLRSGDRRSREERRR